MNLPFDGSRFQALKFTPKPADYADAGHFAVAAVTGTMAAGIAGNSEIFQFRWTSSALLALIQEVRIDAMNSLGTGFTAGVGTFHLTAARGWSAAGTGGGAMTLTGNNNKLRTAMAGTAVGEIRVATTAALGAGTKTLDGNSLAYTKATISASTNTVFLGGTMGPVRLWGPDVGSGEHPLVLTTNEGFVVRGTVPATGTWEIAIGVRWAEVPAY